MQSNQPSPRDSTQFPLTGAELLAELTNPESQLSKDLKNAREEAAANEKVRERIAIQESIAKQQARKLEDLENELAAEREKLQAKSRADFDKINAEREQAAKQEAELLSASAKQDNYKAALILLERHVRELKNIEQELEVVQHQYEEKEKKYTDSKIKFADTVIAEMNSDACYEVNDKGNIVELNPDKYSSEELNEKKRNGKVLSWNSNEYSAEQKKEIQKADSEVHERIQQTKPAAFIKNILQKAKHQSTSEEMEPYAVEREQKFATVRLGILMFVAASAREKNKRNASQIMTLKMSSRNVELQSEVVSGFDKEASSIFTQLSKLRHSHEIQLQRVENDFDTAERYSPHSRKMSHEHFAKLRGILKRPHHDSMQQQARKNGSMGA